MCNRRLGAAAALLCGGLLALSAGMARSDVIYDNGLPDQVNGNEMTQWIQAEDFVLGLDTTLTDVHYWSVEIPGAYQGSIVWTIYADAAGTPGAQLYRGTAAPTRVATGNSLGFGDEFTNQFDVLPNVNLLAGSYWLGLHNGPLTFDIRSEYYWETTAPLGNGNEDDTPFDDSSWFNNGQEHAFYLTGTAVPEPSALALLLGSGVAGGLFAFRRIRR